MIPVGFSFSAANAGVKTPDFSRNDLGLIFCDREAVVTGVFTKNTLKAAPVLIAQDLLQGRGTFRAVFANSGNANACTGEAGVRDAYTIMECVAGHLDITREEVLPLSTGVIGVRMPVERITGRVSQLVEGLARDPEPFARSIMTTDTFPKIVRKSAGKASVLGIAKGAGMIAPDMATTLAVVMTDATLERIHLIDIIQESVVTTFNAITVDGDMSTNDSLIALSSCVINEEIQVVKSALQETIRELALMIVRDGEGATKLVSITVTGTEQRDDARKVCLTVANSLLVKTALFGADPNWGRILAAVGYSSVPVESRDIRVLIQGLRVVESGHEAPDFNEEVLHEALKSNQIHIEIIMGAGKGSFTVWTTDLSHRYIEINAGYRT